MRVPVVGALRPATLSRSPPARWVTCLYLAHTMCPTEIRAGIDELVRLRTNRRHMLGIAWDRTGCCLVPATIRFIERCADMPAGHALATWWQNGWDLIDCMID